MQSKSSSRAHGCAAIGQFVSSRGSHCAYSSSSKHRWIPAVPQGAGSDLSPRQLCVCVSLCLLCFTESWKSVRVCVGKKNSLEEWLRAAAAASFTVSHSLRRDPHTKWLKQRVNWEMHSRWFHIFPWIPASWNLCNYRVESHSDTRRCYKGDLVLQPHFHFFTQHLTCTVRSRLSLTDSNKAKGTHVLT